MHWTDTIFYNTLIDHKIKDLLQVWSDKEEQFTSKLSCGDEQNGVIAKECSAVC